MLIAILMAAALLAACTAIHYKALWSAASAVDPAKHPGRCFALTVAVIAGVHMVEALLFAVAFSWAEYGLNIGQLVPPPTSVDPPPDFMDRFYFSLVNYTTLGRGDLIPKGHLRFLTATEAFTGFLFLTASGAFLLQILGGKNPFRGQKGSS